MPPREGVESPGIDADFLRGFEADSQPGPEIKVDPATAQLEEEAGIPPEGRLAPPPEPAEKIVEPEPIAAPVETAPTPPPVEKPAAAKVETEAAERNNILLKAADYLHAQMNRNFEERYKVAWLGEKLGKGFGAFKAWMTGEHREIAAARDLGLTNEDKKRFNDRLVKVAKKSGWAAGLGITGAILAGINPLTSPILIGALIGGAAARGASELIRAKFAGQENQARAETFKIKTEMFAKASELQQNAAGFIAELDKPETTPERKAEIEAYLDKSMAYLMNLAHEQSVKALVASDKAQLFVEGDEGYDNEQAKDVKEQFDARTKIDKRNEMFADLATAGGSFGGAVLGRTIAQQVLMGGHSEFANEAAKKAFEEGKGRILADYDSKVVNNGSHWVERLSASDMSKLHGIEPNFIDQVKASGGYVFELGKEIPKGLNPDWLTTAQLSDGTYVKALGGIPSPTQMAEYFTQIGNLDAVKKISELNATFWPIVGPQLFGHLVWLLNGRKGQEAAPVSQEQRAAEFAHYQAHQKNIDRAVGLLNKIKSAVGRQKPASELAAETEQPISQASFEGMRQDIGAQVIEQDRAAEAISAATAVTAHEMFSHYKEQYQLLSDEEKAKLPFEIKESDPKKGSWEKSIILKDGKASHILRFTEGKNGQLNVELQAASGKKSLFGREKIVNYSMRGKDKLTYGQLVNFYKRIDGFFLPAAEPGTPIAERNSSTPSEHFETMAGSDRTTVNRSETGTPTEPPPPTPEDRPTEEPAKRIINVRSEDQPTQQNRGGNDADYVRKAVGQSEPKNVDTRINKAAFGQAFTGARPAVEVMAEIKTSEKSREQDAEQAKQGFDAAFAELGNIDSQTLARAGVEVGDGTLGVRGPDGVYYKIGVQGDLENKNRPPSFRLYEYKQGYTPKSGLSAGDGALGGRIDHEDAFRLTWDQVPSQKVNQIVEIAQQRLAAVAEGTAVTPGEPELPKARSSRKAEAGEPINNEPDGRIRTGFAKDVEPSPEEEIRRAEEEIKAETEAAAEVTQKLKEAEAAAGPIPPVAEQPIKLETIDISAEALGQNTVMVVKNEGSLFDGENARTREISYTPEDLARGSIVISTNQGNRRLRLDDLKASLVGLKLTSASPIQPVRVEGAPTGEPVEPAPEPEAPATATEDAPAAPVPETPAAVTPESAIEPEVPASDAEAKFETAGGPAESGSLGAVLAERGKTMEDFQVGSAFEFDADQPANFAALTSIRRGLLNEADRSAISRIREVNLNGRPFEVFNIQPVGDPSNPTDYMVDFQGEGPDNEIRLQTLPLSELVKIIK